MFTEYIVLGVFIKETLHIYTRVSSDIQESDGMGLDVQKEYGIKKSVKLGFKYKVWNVVSNIKGLL